MCDIRDRRICWAFIILGGVSAILFLCNLMVTYYLYMFGFILAVVCSLLLSNHKPTQVMYILLIVVLLLDLGNEILRSLDVDYFNIYVYWGAKLLFLAMVFSMMLPKVNLVIIGGIIDMLRQIFFGLLWFKFPDQFNFRLTYTAFHITSLLWIVGALIMGIYGLRILKRHKKEVHYEKKNVDCTHYSCHR